ncbi:hypothetical protein [Brevundimonas sp. DWR2-3-1b1]|uniref:hypothetical protein n=1 Tax=unclassified Brevundimonas TaxID=2622653 RepID=UPI003CF31DEC
MTQLDAREHFKEIVAAGVGEYVEAEAELTAATQAADEDRIQKARFRALRLGGAAAIYLHHFADIVAKRPSKGLPDFESSVAKVREFLQAKGAVDLTILGDAADSLQHAVLTYRLPRQVEEAGQVPWSLGDMALIVMAKASSAVVNRYGYSRAPASARLRQSFAGLPLCGKTYSSAERLRCGEAKQANGSATFPGSGETKNLDLAGGIDGGIAF